MRAAAQWAEMERVDGQKQGPDGQCLARWLLDLVEFLCLPVDVLMLQLCILALLTLQQQRLLVLFLV